jgi:ferredoxin
MKVLYFSATGNSLYVAKRIGGESCYSIPKLLKAQEVEFEDDAIGLVFPVYFFGVPSIVENFLNKANMRSNYVFAVLSYGRYSGIVASELIEIGKKRGIEFSYLNKVRMVDNYLLAFDMEKEIENEPKMHIENQLDMIIQDVKNRKKFIKKDNFIDKIAVFGLRKYHRGVLDKVVLVDPLVFDQNFYIGETCNGCGICSKVCPVENIELIDKKPVYLGGCIRCMACASLCPNNAIRLKGEKSQARFRNQNVTVKEIINAND